MTEQERYNQALAYLREDSDLYRTEPVFDARRAIPIMLERDDDELIDSASEALLDAVVAFVETIEPNQRGLTSALVDAMLAVAMRKLVDLRDAQRFGALHGLTFVREVGGA